jgi:hypothetical protein
MLHFIYIFSTNISTEYFKHAANSLFFSSKCRLFHNATFFGSCIIHILHTEEGGGGEEEEEEEEGKEEREGQELLCLLNLVELILWSTKNRKVGSKTSEANSKSVCVMLVTSGNYLSFLEQIVCIMNFVHDLCTHEYAHVPLLHLIC